MPLQLRTKNQIVSDALRAQLILSEAADAIRKDKLSPDQTRSFAFGTLRRAQDYLMERTKMLPEAWFCTDCGRAGCGHASREVATRAERAKASSVF